MKTSVPTESKLTQQYRKASAISRTKAWGKSSGRARDAGGGIWSSSMTASAKRDRHRASTAERAGRINGRRGALMGAPRYPDFRRLATGTRKLERIRPRADGTDFLEYAAMIQLRMRIPAQLWVPWLVALSGAVVGCSDGSKSGDGDT